MKKETYFYADNLLDYIIFKNIHTYLKEVKIVSKNKSVQEELRSIGVESDVYPVFPKTIIMARHSLHKFPSSQIKKIGLRHGAYHFKSFISPKKYNRFDLFLLTSDYEVNEARQIGITSAMSGGFPKIDDLFKADSIKNSKKLKSELFDNDKKTILFTATWEKSGLSALDKWYDKLDKLSEKFNILVTVHPWTDEKKINKIKSTPKVHFIQGNDLTYYLLMADIMVADTSSIIAEYNALNKPIISFKVQVKGRLTDKIVEILENLTIRIETYDDLVDFLENEKIYEPNIELSNYYNKIFFDLPLGNHGKKASDIIKSFLS